MTPRFHYRHYGLAVAADAELPGLDPEPDRAADGDADLTISVRRQPLLAPVDTGWAPTDRPVVWRSGGRVRLRFTHAGESADFVIDEGGMSVAVTLTARVPDADAGDLLAGPVFSCVLAQRGACCVHAAVLAIDGEVVALAGPSGAGKSTLALALVRAGATLLADDVAALAAVDGRVTVAPGSRFVRLARDAAEAHEERFDELPRVGLHPDRGVVDKALVAVRAQCPTRTERRVLGRVVFLEPREPGLATPRTKALEPHEALLRLMRHRHAPPLLDAEADRRHFPLLGDVARAVPTFALRRPEGVGALAATAELLAAATSPC